MPVTGAVKLNITETFDEFLHKAEELMPAKSNQRSLRTDRKKSTRLNDFSVEESIGERSSQSVEIKSCFFKIIDIALTEFNNLITENNEFLLAISNSPDMEMNDLKLLEKNRLATPFRG